MRKTVWRGLRQEPLLVGLVGLAVAFESCPPVYSGE